MDSSVYGNVFVMPCKIGDKLFHATNEGIQECEFQGIQVYSGVNNGNPLMYLSHKPIKYKVATYNLNTGTRTYGECDDTMKQINLSEIGKSVFLSLSEAQNR